MDLSKFDLSKLNIDPTVLPHPLKNVIDDSLHRNREMIRAVEASRQEREATEERRHSELLSVGKEQVNKLQEINEQLSEKLSAANKTLDFILNSMGANFQRIERQHLLENTTLTELLSIVSVKDENRLKKFIEEHGADSLGLILQMVSFFIAG